MSKIRKQQMTERRTMRSFLISLGIWFAVLCWGSAYVAARFLLHPDRAGFVSLSPLMLAALRFSIAALCFAVPLLQAIRHHHISRRALLQVALLGLFTFTLYYWLQYLGIEQTNASIASVLGVGLIPLFTTLLAHLFGAERFTSSLVAFLLLGFLGVALIVFQQPLNLGLHSGFLLGAGCLLANTFSFALYTNVSKRWMQDIPPVVLTAGSMMSGALGLLLLSLFDPFSHWNEIGLLHLSQWFAILFLALACSVGAYFAYNMALSKFDASRVAVYFYVEPIVAIGLGVALLGEQLTWQTILGTLAIGISVLAVTRLK